MQSYDHSTSTLYIITLFSIHSEHDAQLNANGSPPWSVQPSWVPSESVRGFHHKNKGQPATFKETATRLRRRLYFSEAPYINKVLRFQRVTFITCAIPYWHIYMTNYDSASTEEKKILHIRYIYTSSQRTQARRKCFILFKSMKKKKRI